MNEELPDWVWTLVIGIEAYEYEHDAKGAGCIDYLLEAVPSDVLWAARILDRLGSRSDRLTAVVTAARRADPTEREETTTTEAPKGTPRP